MTKPNDRLQWFLYQVGHVVYRNDTGCTCEVCQHITKNGLRVDSNFHAEYLYDNETESNGEGFPLRYFETKEERDEWLKTLPK